MATAQSVINKAKEYLGVKEGTVAHHRIIDAYNQVRPVPAGYLVKYSDEWCDAFVSFIGDKAGASELIGRECGVQRHIKIFEELGIWRGKEFPKMGDVVTFDWDSNGWADHIGFVEKVENNRITTIEGNSNGRVERNTFTWNDKRIKGYARPKYKIIGEIKKTIEEVAKEVIAGKWSSGQARISALLAAGYDARQVQSKVNELLSPGKDKAVSNELVGMSFNGSVLSEKHLTRIIELAKEYNILPSLLIVMLHFEGVWGNSNVARNDNNWGGMTWADSYVGNPNIRKTKGSKRPATEGSHYIHYSSVEDFFEDWVYLLRPGGTYKVSGVMEFRASVKGLFKIGGAKYDYAELGYTNYLNRMVARKEEIDKSNPGVLDKIDNKFGVGKKPKEVTQEKLKVSESATHWYTGEQIPSWVKDLEFELIEEKEVTQKAYLLGNGGIAIGWVVDSDIIKVS